MKKGKSKKTEKKYLSIVLIPHSQKHVRVLKFRAFYLKLAVCFTLLVAVFIYGGIYISDMLEENKSLKSNLSELYNTNADQRSLIEQKTEENETLKKDSAEYQELVNDKIEEFTESYNKLTDEYLDKRMSSQSSRSGGGNEVAFSNDIQELKGQLDSLINLYTRADKPVADISAAESKLNVYLDKIPTLWPVSGGRITDYFGYRKDPFTGRKKYHEGIDIGVDTGTKIRAAADGTVIMSEYTRGYGRAVKIKHANGLVTVYGHCSKLLASVGDKVKKGDVVANVGSSGRSTGPHLHFEVQLYGTAVDPLKYLDNN